MPYRRQWLTQVDIPGLGTATLKSVTMGTIIDAAKLASQTEEDKRAAAFTNFILADMLIEPAKTSEEVANLPTDSMAVLVEVAAVRLGVRKEFDSSPLDLSPHERLYQAYREHAHALLTEFTASVAKSFGGSLDQIYGQAAKALGNLSISQNILKHISENFGLMSSLNANLMSFNIPSEVFTKQKALQGFYQTINLDRLPIQKIFESVDRIKIPEPFLSDTLLASGLNSPLLHSQTYTLPEIRPMYTPEDVKSRAKDAKRQRLLDAYDILSELEQSLRDFIEIKLREIHGDKWWKRGVPEGVRKACEERKQAKEKPFDPAYHPIYYTYPDDYKTIIIKRDNWDAAFGLLFGNKTELEACFAWVVKVRDPVAHARPISDDDYSRFVVAARWLRIALNRHMPPGDL